MQDVCASDRSNELGQASGGRAGEPCCPSKAARHGHARRAYPLVHRDIRDHLQVAAEQVEPSGVPRTTPGALIKHVQMRRAEGAGPATAINDLIWIGVVLRAAKSVKELPVRPEIVQQARSTCRELRLIAKPRKRTRRPTCEGEISVAVWIGGIESNGGFVVDGRIVLRLSGPRAGQLHVGSTRLPFPLVLLPSRKRSCSHQ